MDELIKQFAGKLHDIYHCRTAGDYTFEGVLSEFARAIDRLPERRSILGGKPHGPVAKFPV